MMKQKLFSCAFVSLLVLTGCGQQSEEAPVPEEEVVQETVGPNQLTQAEIDDGWVLLFDGETSTGWTGYKKDSFPAGWQVVDGTLFCQGSGRGEAGGVEGGDVVYEKPFSNFQTASSSL